MVFYFCIGYNHSMNVTLDANYSSYFYYEKVGLDVHCLNSFNTSTSCLTVEQLANSVRSIDAVSIIDITFSSLTHILYY